MTTPETLLDRPIFIAGPGRSGTTLLRSLLSAHSAISITPETQYMKWASDRGDLGGGPDDFDRFWQEYTDWVRFRDLGVDPDHCLEHMEGHDRTFERVFRTVLTAYGERTDARRVGEKSPSHVHFLDELHRWFPTATFLILQRDPRAIIASQLKTPYVRDRIRRPSLRRGVLTDRRIHQVVHFAREWREIHGRILPRWAGDDRVGVVVYEALVRDPETELRRICERLGEPFEPSMLRERSTDAAPPPAGTTPNEALEHWRRDHHAKSRAPVSTDSVEKWRRDLDARDVALIEAICGREMQAAGYELESGPALRWSTGAAFRVLEAAETVERKARAAARLS